MLLIGRLFGSIKLASDGAILKALVKPGVEKSSISLFQTMPSVGDTRSEPSLQNLHAIVTNIIHLKEYFSVKMLSENNSFYSFRLLLLNEKNSKIQLNKIMQIFGNRQ